MEVCLNLKSKLETYQLSDNCVINTYITYDENNYVLEIDYMNGKFTAEKTFINNYYGIAEMEEVRTQYRNEDDVKKYFGII